MSITKYIIKYIKNKFIIISFPIKKSAITSKYFNNANILYETPIWLLFANLPIIYCDIHGIHAINGYLYPLTLAILNNPIDWNIYNAIFCDNCN